MTGVQTCALPISYATAPHVAGYIGEVSKKQVEESGGLYQRGDYRGISGLEKSYEKELKGKNGEEYILVNVFNVAQGK